MDQVEGRRAHSLDFKKTMLDYLAINNGSISIAANAHNITAKGIQQWRKEERNTCKDANGRDTGKSWVVQCMREKIAPLTFDAKVIELSHK